MSQLEFGVFAGYRLLAMPRPDQHGWLGMQVETAPARHDADGTPATAHVVLETADRSTRRRLHLEATAIEAALTTINSPVLAGLLAHAVDSQDRPVLITAPFGPSLAMEVANRGPMAIGNVLAAAEAAAAGLEALHQIDLLHRALSPRAILRGPNRQMQLSSPTLPLLAERVAASTGGTGHEPPEVLAGEGWSVAAEVYALASTLWTLLAGRPPTAGSQEERLATLLRGEPPQMRRSDVPDFVAAALTHALDPDPAGRPHSSQMLAELTRSRGSMARALAVPTDQQLTRPPAHSMPVQGSNQLPAQGRPLGRGYWLDAKIGSGSTGTVYRARRLKDNAVLAAKLLRAELADEPDTVTRFLGERTTLMRLRHPNLVRVHELVSEGDDLAIVMDLVDGVDLRRLTKTRIMDRSDALRLLSQIADALTAVHDTGIVHRDLKPENVLVSQDGTALLTDFGLARMIDRPTVTRRSEIVGTPAYLAPELATGGQVTPACDVYALGITGYELLAGYRPFRAENAAAALRAHLEDRPKRSPTMADGDWAVLSACLEKQPSARPTARQVANALAKLAASPDSSRTASSLAPAVSSRGLPAPLPSDASAEPADPRRRRWLLLLVAVFVTAVVLAAGIGISLSSTGQSSLPLYPVSANVTIRLNSAIELDWPTDAEKLPGFRYYSVWRNGKPIKPQLDAGKARYVDLEPGSNPCYLVYAVGVSLPPSAPSATPNCPYARN